ncbi:hypothetical protein F3Y22_tig00110458pilonHSYRG00509 [Hibiscus syriacus]|uniref:Uncharacterized protein n=1 Tax=Hibiscus syriacus TaxID=106335 RepID=A0A6A3AIC1_HIBSY|nr:hypothetical protein F3Y22_tig00110458pilonHSYRG00509 [Hibiscus syriacus]
MQGDIFSVMIQAVCSLHQASFPAYRQEFFLSLTKLVHHENILASLEKYLIAININGIHIRVELGGQLGYYIDILACSTKNLTETLAYQPAHSSCNSKPLPWCNVDRKHLEARMCAKPGSS